MMTNTFKILCLRHLVSAAVIIAASTIVQGAAKAQSPTPPPPPLSQDIPLQFVTVGKGYKLGIYVGLGTSASTMPSSGTLYEFDTGSSPFAAANEEQWPSDSDRKTIATIPTTGSGYVYGSRDTFYGNVVNVQSIGFYASSTATTPLYTLPTLACGGYQVLKVTSGSGRGNDGKKIEIHDSMKANSPIADGAFPGVFGASNFVGTGYTTQSSSQSQNSQCSSQTKPPQVVLSSVLGQSFDPTTTKDGHAGYIVAANGQPYPPPTVNGQPKPKQLPTAYGPQGSQEVTKCSPCLILGLTDALLAQFTRPVPNGKKNLGTFPNSGAPSSMELNNYFTFKLEDAAAGVSSSWTAPALLDTGTQYMNLNDSSRPVPSSLTTTDKNKKGKIIIYAKDSRLSIVGDVLGAAKSSQPVDNYSPSGDITFQVKLNHANKKGNPANVVGLPFFLHNSVLFNLSGQEVGYTADFVTDVNLETPLTIGYPSPPLGLAGVIWGSGGLSIDEGGSATLSGTNTYTGATTIKGGGTLRLVGTGSIEHSSEVINSGAFDIDFSASATINGNLTLQRGGIYRVHVDPSGASSATINGTASLAGNVQVIFASGSYPSQETSTTILHASGGRTGELELITINLPPDFKASLSYTPTDVTLSVVKASDNALPPAKP
jgi:autotransporter-associated beta strand protein